MVTMMPPDPDWTRNSMIFSDSRWTMQENPAVSSSSWNGANWVQPCERMTPGNENGGVADRVICMGVILYFFPSRVSLPRTALIFSRKPGTTCWGKRGQVTNTARTIQTSINNPLFVAWSNATQMNQP